jgi:mRNA interferase RelE/StbE
MAWKVEFSPVADRQLSKLDPHIAQQVLRFLSTRVAQLENPRSIGQALQGERFGELWRYRVGDYRLICKIEDAHVAVLVLQIGHRREVYR